MVFARTNRRSGKEFPVSQANPILPPAKVVVIGLGNMGQPMAACMTRAG
jgi:hypothetical protein